MEANSESENSYVARQTIVGPNKRTIGYELLFRDSWNNAFPNISLDEATTRLITETQLGAGIERLVGDHRAFINFSQQSLLDKYPLFFDKDKVVVEILDCVEPTDDVIIACQDLKEQGYKLALDDFEFNERWEKLSKLVDIIKFDITGIDPDILANKVEATERGEKSLVAERVETHEQFEFCKEIGFDYFQGYFFSKPEVVEKRNLPSNKMVMLELLGETAKDPMEFDKISDMISRDVGLSFKLLKFINSPAFGAARDIKSLNHAMSYLGEIELRKFISLLAMASLGDDKPPALISLAAVRARFAEIIMNHLSKPDLMGSAFLSGLFSLIEAVMNDSLESIFRKLPIDNNIKEALRGRECQTGDVLKLVLAYEQGEWKAVSEICEKLKLEEGVLGGSYREAICWARSFEKALPED